ncbi:hypothetical protein M9H77_34334 [Catharanthus roseus]|uniref:Uncharacterized protein n=1 Tax=Catharanthus roseus TaxID=4058 RepID=A0ACB9ZML1_CATRO|nr:hypothetical protein M9H77_34334 [Catharanthus roseus]
MKLKSNEEALYAEFKKQYLAQKQQAGETSYAKKDVIPKADLIKSYMKELKKELIKNLLSEDKTDISIASSSNDEDCLAGESQDPVEDMDEDNLNEDAIDHMVQEMEDAAKKAIK